MRVLVLGGSLDGQVLDVRDNQYGLTSLAGEPYVRAFLAGESQQWPVYALADMNGDAIVAAVLRVAMTKGVDDGEARGG